METRTWVATTLIVAIISGAIAWMVVTYINTEAESRRVRVEACEQAEAEDVALCIRVNR